MGSTDANKGDAAAQTRETLARLGRTMKAAGFDWSDVVDAVVYLPSVKDFAAMNAAYREVFPKAIPGPVYGRSGPRLARRPRRDHDDGSEEAVATSGARRPRAAQNWTRRPATGVMPHW